MCNATDARIDEPLARKLMANGPKVLALKHTATEHLLWCVEGPELNTHLAKVRKLNGALRCRRYPR